MPSQGSEEGHDLWATDILGVNLPVETESNALSRERDGTYDR